MKNSQGIRVLDERQRNHRAPTMDRAAQCADGGEHMDRWDPVRGCYECAACRATRTP